MDTNVSPLRLPVIRTAMHMSRSTFAFPNAEHILKQKQQHPRKKTRKPTLYALDALQAFQSHNFSIAGTLVVSLLASPKRDKKVEKTRRRTVVHKATSSQYEERIGSIEDFPESLNQKKEKPQKHPVHIQTTTHPEPSKLLRKASNLSPVVRLTTIESSDLESDNSFSDIRDALQVIREKRRSKKPPKLFLATHSSEAEITCREVNIEYGEATAAVLSDTRTLMKRRTKAMVIPERLFKM